jgi:hypothetical protein
MKLQLDRLQAPLKLLIVFLLVLAISGCGQSTPAPSPTSQPSSPQETVPPNARPPESTTTTPTSTPQQGVSLPPQAELEEARRLYPPEVTRALLMGHISAPAGVDAYLAERIGRTRIQELRSGKGEPTGMENDIAAICLMELRIPVESSRFVPSGDGGQQPGGLPGLSVSRVESSYRVALGNLSGWFTNGQEADIMLSGIDFNNAGGPLLFNHPKGIATDGTHLLLADGNNNRVLIWNSLPTGNTPPDLVLGQPNFTTNYPGTGRHQMNWPASVATDGTHVVVADTYNDRILIWNQLPTQNAAPADIVLDGKTGFQSSKLTKNGFSWPWGVWTNGQKLVVSSTRGGYVLIWNSFPTRDNQPADLYLTAGGNFGTPRTITSDGKSLIIGDHNAENTSSAMGNFFWKHFPTKDDEPYDFFRPGAWMTGDFTQEGKLVMLGETLHIWNSFPAIADEPPAISISGFKFTGGDGAGLAIASNRIYISLYNGNRVVVYHNIPTTPLMPPDFAIGSPDINTNTLDTHYFITNGIPTTDGKSLFVSSDFDRRLYVWKQIPDESGAYPDLVYSLPEAPWDNALWGSTLALAGKDTVMIWKTLPLEGQPFDISFKGSIGGITFKELGGVALDDKYFYLSDTPANKIYVWDEIPDADIPPLFSLTVELPGRLSSDGEYLIVTSLNSHSVLVFRVAELSTNARPVATIGGPGKFNLPQSAIVAGGGLFIADTCFNRVHIWEKITDAISGKSADVILGKGGPDVPPLQRKDALFWPAGLAFDGSYLWVGEFKFGNRLLRFSVR